MKIYDLTVIVTKDEDSNFIATCPVLQGCYADGATLNEVLETMKDVMKMHIEARLDDGDIIPVEVYSSQLKVSV